MEDLVKRLIKQASVICHWLPSGNAFWYIHYAPDKKFSFNFVDVLKKTREPAFDHEKLAAALGRQTGESINHEALPFTWIHIQSDASFISFRFAGKMWQYGPGDALKEGVIQIDPRLLQKEVASSDSSKEVSVKFINYTGGDLQRFWIGRDGESVAYSDIRADEIKTRVTCVGHVWRLVDKASGKVKTIYCVPDQEQDVLIIDDEEYLESGGETENNENEKGKEGEKGEENAEGKQKNKTDEGPETKPETKNDHPDNSITTPDSNGKLNDTDEPAREAVVLDHKLWLKEPDGSKTVLSSAEHKYDDSNCYMSPDERFAVAWQYIPEQDHTVNLIDSSPSDQLQPKLKSIQYLKAGDRVRVDRPRLFDLDNKREIPTEDALFANPYSLTDIGWNKSGEEYRFIFNKRGHQSLSILAIHRDGVVRIVVDEKSDTFIDYSSKMKWKFFKDTDELVWASERDGYNHLYLIDLATGTVKNQITQGQWNVVEIDRVDEGRRRLWLKCYGLAKDQDPYYAHLARVNFDGSGFRILTKGDGTHTWKWSLNWRYFIDTWSRVDFPPQMVLRDAESGDQIMFLEGGTLDELKKEGWNAPERFVAAGRDGTTVIYGIIVRPPGLDESKVYPILERIYAGPTDFSTPKAFSYLQTLREWSKEGFVVVKMDGMGTNWRSKAFHDVCHKNLKDSGLPDRISWIKAAASTRPWMDLSRVGIFGGSAGGQNAVAALLHHGDFYKAASADCGCHDNRMGMIWWNEQWMGYPVDESYAESSNITHAAKLQGALLLTVGELDENVDPASTIQLVHALNKADKDYELLLIPGGDHCAGRFEYGTRREKAFFRRHLQQEVKSV